MASSHSNNNNNNNSTSKNDLWNFQQRKDLMMQNISSQWKNSQSSRAQVKQGLQTLGTKLQQGGQDLLAKSNTNETQQRLKEQFQNVVGNKLPTINLATKFTTDATARGSGLTGQLEMFNERMKEEALRRDVRREAEEACMQTMRDHLSEFLQNDAQNSGTYEEWIFALHPENTQDASLLQDMEYKEVDSRFYVEESDHRRLWNDMVKDTPHRQIEARTRMWSSSNPHNGEEQQKPVDLLGFGEIQNQPSPSQPQPQPDNSGAIADPFAVDTLMPMMDSAPINTSHTGSQEQEADLISF